MAEHQQHRSDEEMGDETSDENNEIEKLEQDVKLMAQKIADFRDTLPNQLQSNLASILSAQRPVILDHSDTDPGPSSTTPNPGSESGVVIEDDHVHNEKIQTIKQKISSNASAMSSLLKRMKDCMSRIDNLESFNKGIHPAFKRRKIASENSVM
ncbi:uncharacterized protein [Rutidosis leptorrhynchoides]|uniref:uncharacterized protein n=1 Tax=Rutidosis leptorrhynchoides TaxID=125765 RepID=UPI003A99B9C8